MDTKSIIIEYDTPFCHPNKNYMTIDEYNKWEFPFNVMTPDEKFDYDEQKKLLARKNGHYVFTAYIKNPTCIETQLNELIQKIKIIC